MSPSVESQWPSWVEEMLHQSSWVLEYYLFVELHNEALFAHLNLWRWLEQFQYVVYSHLQKQTFRTIELIEISCMGFHETNQ